MQAVTGTVVVELVGLFVEQTREEGLEAEPVVRMRGRAEAVVVVLVVIHRLVLMTVTKA